MVTTNPNSFLFKKPKVTTPATPDYTKVIGSSDAGSQVIKGTPLDTNIKIPQVSPMGSTPAPAPEKQIFNQKFSNQGGFNPVSVTQTPQTPTDSMYKNPVVPTKENPVVVREKPTTQVGGVDYADIDNMDVKTIQRYIDESQVKASNGEEITSSERARLLAASRRLNELNTAATAVDPYQAQIEAQTKAREEEAARLKAQSEALMTTEEKRLAAKYANLTSQAQQSGERVSQASKWAMSFSGLGRSTFNADQQVQIQQQTENNLAALEETKNLEIEKYNAALAGADAKALESYDTRINTLLTESAKYQADQAKALNEFNQTNQATYQEKINNLMSYAQSWTDPNTPLTEEELAQAKAFGSLLIDKDGKVNEKFAEQIPAKLYGKALESAAEARGAIPQEQFDFMNLGSGLVAKTNKVTGEVEWYQGDVKLTPLEAAKINEINAGIGKTVADTNAINQKTSPSTNTPSTNAAQLISRWEGFREKAYPDPATGGAPWTIGFGFTSLNGKPVKPGDTIDRASAEQLLQKEISQRQNFMNYITVPLNENQKAALASFEFNLGSGIWDKNAKPILDKVNQGDLAGAASLMKQYVNANGKPMQGLVNRRNEEANLLQSQAQGGDMSMQVAGLTQGLGGTEGERQKLQDNIVKVAQRDGISLQDAKKKLGYKTSDDVEFAKARKEQLSAITKSSDAIKNGKQTLNLLSNENTAIGDVSTVFSFLKTLDPASVARETEVAAVTNAQSLLGRMEVAFSKLKSGRQLSDQQRAEMKSAIETIVNAYENNLRDTVSSAKQEFDDRGLDATVYISKNMIDKYGNTNTKQTTQQSNIPASLANPVSTKPSSQANADYLKSLGITQ